MLVSSHVHACTPFAVEVRQSLVCEYAAVDVILNCVELVDDDGDVMTVCHCIEEDEEALEKRSVGQSVVEIGEQESEVVDEGRLMQVLKALLRINLAVM